MDSWRSWRRAVLCLLFVLFMGNAMGGIVVSSTSTMTVAPRAPYITVENAGPTACTFTPNANQTGGAVVVLVATGTTDHGGCIRIRNTDSQTWVYKIRHVSATNPSRFNDVQVKTSGGDQHIKYSGGSLSTSETGSWLSISAGGSTTTNIRERTDAGPQSVITAELLVARSGMQTRVWAVYPLTFTFTAS